MTSPAVLVSPMRPVDGRASRRSSPGARGVLFVAADHQHWYMTLRGLQPAAAGQAYKLWFVADTGAVSAGSFTAQPGAPIELSSQHMPAGTKGVMVTLEDDAQAPAPSGPEILRAASFYPARRAGGGETLTRPNLDHRLTQPTFGGLAGRISTRLGRAFGG